MNKSYIEWLDYYENATKEDVIQDMMLDIKEIDRLKRENKIFYELSKDYYEKIFKAIKKIESVRIYGLRSGKTLIATLLNDILDILQGSDKDE